MKGFRDFAKNIVKNISAQGGQNNQNIKENLSKRVNNFADFLETGKEDEKQSQEEIYKQKIREQYQRMDQQEETFNNQKYYEQMTGQKLNVEQEKQQQQTNKKENEPQTEQTEKIPFMITRAMKLDLYNLGYELEQINEMTPKQANDILKKKKQ